MAARVVRVVYVASLVLGWIGLASAPLRAADGREVIVLPTTGTVDNVMSSYLAESIAVAERDGATAVVIKLNTPGGSLTATNDIVGTILEANVPVIVWVAPAGGFAASAGTFITLASHVALMAPGTSIGAASPVLATGEDVPKTLQDKVFNDAAAKIKSIAHERGRNVEWAESAVRQAASASASEAVDLNVVDGVASTIDDVLSQANGRQVEVGDTPVTLELTGAAIRTLEMNPFQGFLHLLSDPNITAVLFSVGSAGLLWELISPNFVTGILGAIMIILAFIGGQSLPLNIGGLLLIALAMLLFGLEVTVVSHGLLTVGGLVCFFLGLSALYTAPGTPTAPNVEVAFPLILTMTLTIASFMAIALVTVIRSRRRSLSRALVGYGAGGSTTVAPGTPGQVRVPLTPLGSVYAVGEEWTARTTGPPIERGTSVRVVAQEGLTLIVEPVEPAVSGA